MCSAPVTLGGGITMTNLGLLDPCFGVKKPHVSHHVYQPDSTTRGQYALAISPDMSLRVPGGSARAASRAACSSASACASFASLSAVSACAARRSRAACQRQSSHDHALVRLQRTFFLGALVFGASAAAAAAFAMLLAAFSALSRACGRACVSAAHLTGQPALLPFRLAWPSSPGRCLQWRQLLCHQPAEQGSRVKRTAQGRS
jgi:hypothetical protein